MPGDHLSVSMGFYTHHGIDAGDGKVIHFGRGIFDLENACVEEVTFEDFAGGRKVVRVESDVDFPPDEVVRRARSRLGETGYDVFDNNCEHFVNWCRTGVTCSSQANAGRSAIRQTLALVTKPVLRKIVARGTVARAVAKPLVAVDIAQAGIEVIAARQGMSEKQSEKLAETVGASLATGVGLMMAGRAGAASALALWVAGQIPLRRNRQEANTDLPSIR